MGQLWYGGTIYTLESEEMKVEAVFIHSLVMKRSEL
jgi:hypothetical protein